MLPLGPRFGGRGEEGVGCVICQCFRLFLVKFTTTSRSLSLRLSLICTWNVGGVLGGCRCRSGPSFALDDFHERFIFKLGEEISCKSGVIHVSEFFVVGYTQQIEIECWQVRRAVSRISIRGCVRPFVGPSVGPCVPCYFGRPDECILGASCAVYPALFLMVRWIYGRTDIRMYTLSYKDAMTHYKIPLPMRCMLSQSSILSMSNWHDLQSLVAHPAA